MTDQRRDDGFSLIELMVALVILAVLIAISIPVFFGIRNRAKDGATHSALTAAAKVEGALASVGGEFTDNLAVLALEEPALDWNGGTPESIHVVVGEVVVGSGLNQQVLVYARSESGVWFGLRLVSVGADGGRHTCSGTAETDVNSLAGCVGSNW